MPKAKQDATKTKMPLSKSITRISQAKSNKTTKQKQPKKHQKHEGVS